MASVQGYLCSDSVDPRSELLQIAAGGFVREFALRTLVAEVSAQWVVAAR